jgi:hypothetical protein
VRYLDNFSFELVWILAVEVILRTSIDWVILLPAISESINLFRVLILVSGFAIPLFVSWYWYASRRRKNSLSETDHIVPGGKRKAHKVNEK